MDGSIPITYKKALGLPGSLRETTLQRLIFVDDNETSIGKQMRYVLVSTTLLVMLLAAAGSSLGAPRPLTLASSSEAKDAQDPRWTVRPLNANCPQPSCSSWRDLNTLWASPDATLFVRCRPAPTGYWMMELNSCAPGTLFQYSKQPSSCLVIINKQSHAVCALVGRPVPVPSQGIGVFGVIVICFTVIFAAGASGWYLIWRNPERRRWVHSMLRCSGRARNDFPSTVYSRVENREVSSLLLNAAISESDDDMLI